MNFRLLLTALFLLLSVAIFAQNAPAGINYQAVARNEKGQVLTNKTISLQISLYAGQTGGKASYSEVHRIQTNELGLFTLVVGKGEAMRGDFQQVPWSTMNIWMELAMDELGGKNFTTISASQLMAVPYAFHAATAGDLANGQNDDGTEKTAAFWKANGNEMTFPGPHYIGTIDAKDFVMKTSSTERLRITAAGNVNITNSLSVGVDLTVGRDAFIGRNIDVDNNANIDFDLTVGGIARFNNTTQSTTKDNGAVIVEGGVGIEKNLNVGGNTVLGGTLNVGGVLTISNTTQSTTKDNGALVVEGGVGIEKNVNIGGNTEVDGSLGVDGATSLNSSLTVTGATTLNSTLAANGQVTITASVGGGDGNINAHPLRVQGSDQGIAIKLSAGTPSSSNNFITFFNSSTTAIGRVEGQTAGDKASEPEYIFQTAIYAAEIVAAGVNIGLSLLPNACVGLGAVACPPEPSVVAIAVAEEIVAIANEAAYQAFSFANLGVTYESGSADYAEWLERSNSAEQMLPGDIVGVNGGKITKKTADASQYLVISTNPAVLGNMPEQGKEIQYEKVAFMGQIPVKVRGQVNIGDYILPSGLNDGSGIGVSPKLITPKQYREIVGIAWSATPEGSRLSAVNMAIGLNTNDVARLVDEQQAEIDAQQAKIAKLESNFAAMEQRLVALESGKPYTPVIATEPVVANSNLAYIEASVPESIDVARVEEAILLLEDIYRAKGIDVENHSGLKKLFHDQAFRQEVILKVQENYLTTRSNIMKMEARRN